MNPIKNDASVVATFKNTHWGFPTSYFLNSDLEVIDVKRGGIPIAPRTAFKKAVEINYNVFNERLVNFMSKKELVRQQVAETD